MQPGIEKRVETDVYQAVAGKLMRSPTLKSLSTVRNALDAESVP